MSQTEIAEYKYIKKDTFRKIPQDDKTLGEELVFERIKSGEIKNIRLLLGLVESRCL